MLKKLATIFRLSGERPHPQQEEKKLELAVAILLVEVMHADHILDQQETELVGKLLQQYFTINAKQAGELLDLAESRVKQAVSLQEYTRFLNHALNYKGKVHLIENMWYVVFADAQVDKYEEHLVRKVADLLYVKHQDFMRTKHLASKKYVT